MMLTWVGHVAHIEPIRCANFSWKTLQRERPLKRCRHCSEDSTKIDCKEIERKDVNWIYLA